MLWCQCPSVSPSVRLSVTEVHWRIIANLGFKFRSHFTAHCGRRAAGGRRAQWRRAARHAACGRIISRHASQCSTLLSVLTAFHTRFCIFYCCISHSCIFIASVDEQVVVKTLFCETCGMHGEYSKVFVEIRLRPSAIATRQSVWVVLYILGMML